MEMSDAIIAFLLISGTVYILGEIARKALPDQITQHPVWARSLPLQPILWGILITLLTSPESVGNFDLTPQAKVVVGIWAGFCAASSFKIVHQTLLGSDSRIKKLSQ